MMSLHVKLVVGMGQALMRKQASQFSDSVEVGCGDHTNIQASRIHGIC